MGFNRVKAREQKNGGPKSNKYQRENPVAIMRTKCFQ